MNLLEDGEEERCVNAPSVSYPRQIIQAIADRLSEQIGFVCEDEECRLYGFVHTTEVEFEELHPECIPEIGFHLDCKGLRALLSTLPAASFIEGLEPLASDGSFRADDNLRSRADIMNVDSWIVPNAFFRGQKCCFGCTRGYICSQCNASLDKDAFVSNGNSRWCVFCALARNNELDGAVALNALAKYDMLRDSGGIAEYFRGTFLKCATFDSCTYIIQVTGIAREFPQKVRWQKKRKTLYQPIRTAPFCILPGATTLVALSIATHLGRLSS